MPVNDKVRIADYNTIQAKVSKILGSGAGSYGYGQSTRSYPVGEGYKVVASHWDNLRNDISSISRHQDYSWASLSDIQEGNKVTYSPHTEYDNRISGLDASRFNLSSSAARTVNKGTNSIDFPGSHGSTWRNKITCRINYAFSNPSQARYFFNAGGKLRFSSSRTGGSSSASNDAWTSLLTSAGIIEFGAITATPATYYTLTDSYQQIFIASPSGVYAYQGNEFRISVKCNAAGGNNSNGTASVLYFLIEWEDTAPYSIDSLYGDNVDGTLSISTNTLEATGILYPGGTFTVESPIVTFGNFTVS